MASYCDEKKGTASCALVKMFYYQSNHSIKALNSIAKICTRSIPAWPVKQLSFNRRYFLFRLLAEAILSAVLNEAVIFLLFLLKSQWES